MTLFYMPDVIDILKIIRYNIKGTFVLNVKKFLEA